MLTQVVAFGTQVETVSSTQLKLVKGLCTIQIFRAAIQDGYHPNADVEVDLSRSESPLQQVKGGEPRIFTKVTFAFTQR